MNTFILGVLTGVVVTGLALMVLTALAIERQRDDDQDRE